jgi:hypothetical protein
MVAIYTTFCFNVNKHYILPARRICRFLMLLRITIISLNSFNQLVFVIETQFVLCAVGRMRYTRVKEMRYLTVKYNSGVLDVCVDRGL